MTIKDSGARRQFKSGAVRDISKGKGRCDLLPLDTLSIWMSDLTYKYLNDYIRNGEIGALYELLDYHIAPEEKASVILELAKHYEKGAEKYEERNWEKGIPIHCYIDSAIRHYLKYIQGLNDENHFIAFIWNIFGALWTHKNRPEMIDLPFVESEKDLEKRNKHKEGINGV